MKNHAHLVIAALFVAIFALLAPTSFAQKADAMSKAQAIAQQLDLTPQQKEKILPFLPPKFQECTPSRTTIRFQPCRKSNNSGLFISKPILR